MNAKTTWLIIAALLLVFYRFGFPWTPFWVDALVITTAMVLGACKSLPKRDPDEGTGGERHAPPAAGPSEG